MLATTLAATVAGAISYLAQFGWFFGGAYGYSGSSGGRGRQQGSMIGLLLMLVLAPIAAMLVQLAVSRTREYSADEGGAKLTGNPMALASALAKIEAWSKNRKVQGKPNPAVTSLYIINPFRGSLLMELFSTHPSTQKRIARLQRIAENMGTSSYY